MFRVSLFNLSADATQVGVGDGVTEIGEVTPADFIQLLEHFAQIDPSQNQEFDPHILVVARAGRFLVRTGRGKLFLYNARDTVEPYAELTSSEIIAALEREPSAPTVAGETSDTPADHAPPHRWTAIGILVAGLALNGYTLYSVFYTQSVNGKPDVTLLTDANDVIARTNAAIGRYATGDQPGDREIIVEAGDRLRFIELGSKNRTVNNTDTFHLGHHGNKYCLTTTESGIIDILNIETLVYYGDTYKRR